MKTRILVHAAGSTVILPGGHVVEGRPQRTPEQAETARDLGYGDDVLGMVRDHDPLHVLLCAWLGIESNSMRAAAGLDHDSELAVIEEVAVIAVQRLMRRGGGRMPL